MDGMSDETKTPRTDAAAFKVWSNLTHEPREAVEVGVARQLETELAEAEESLTTAQLDREWWEKNARETKAKLAKWQAVAERLFHELGNFWNTGCDYKLPQSIKDYKALAELEKLKEESK